MKFSKICYFITSFFILMSSLYLQAMEYEQENNEFILSSSSSDKEESIDQENSDQNKLQKKISSTLKQIRNNTHSLVLSFNKKENPDTIANKIARNDTLNAQALVLIDQLNKTPTISDNYKFQIKKHHDELRALMKNSFVAPLETLKSQLHIINLKNIIIDNVQVQDTDSTKSIEKEVDNYLSTYFNNLLDDSNYVAHIYLNLINKYEVIIGQVASRIGKGQENITQKMIQTNKPLQALLQKFEDAIDFGTLAEKYLSHYHLQPKTQLKQDHTQLTFDLAQQIEKIDPNALVRNSVRNREKQEYYAQKTHLWEIFINQSPKKKNLIKQIKENKKGMVLP
ncbi:MAG: hypothetical protein BWY54_00591 [Candidatus Dependentiae bacterium ADurb.Bin331]|nr:MAG: hypothetical protein BWY54_00591 [Candidatus Dependentiae bacterium ADurb.Bin331]